MAKRAKKMTMRRFGAVRQYRSGRWTASYLDPTGERRRAPETFETRTDAEIWLSQIEADITRNAWRDPDAGAVNFEEYATKWVVERGVAPLTEELYTRLLRLHILPAFGTLDLDEITPPRVREWRAERLTSTGATTVAKSYRLLKAILETAADDELIRRNPCRIRGAGKEVSEAGQVASVEQVDALADAVGIRWRLMVFLGAYGPMRPEEQAELRRKDVDVDNVTITVRKAAPELATGQRAEGPTKSEAGKRVVVLPQFLRTDLQRHLDWYAEKGPDGLLFVGRRAPPSVGPPSGGGGRGLAPRSGCRASASTTSATPGTLSRLDPGRRSRTRWSAPASRPRGRHSFISTPITSGRKR